jgi:hypothetical protein
MPSVPQVAGPGTAARSATPVISDSANGGETRQVRTMPAGVESEKAGRVPTTDGAPAGRTTKLASPIEGVPEIVPDRDRNLGILRSCRKLSGRLST